MVERASFKLEANMERSSGILPSADYKDITSKIAKNLIELCFYDKEASQSDEISFTLLGSFQKPIFGDSLKLYLVIVIAFICVEALL